MSVHFKGRITYYNYSTYKGELENWQITLTNISNQIVSNGSTFNKKYLIMQFIGICVKDIKYHKQLLCVLCD